MAPPFLRDRADDGALRVTNIELFFDLVYVFAFTQLSDFLFDELTLRGALEALILFLAVWQAWSYTAWATNWLDPARGSGALLMVVLIVLSLVMAAAIPRAFEDRGLQFAASYVALQLVRSAFMVGAFPRGDQMRRNFAQLLSWSAIAGVAWIVGATALDGHARLLAWGVAVVLDVAAPVHGYRLPRAGRTPIEAWSLAGSHLAERSQLVLMIALGESVLRVGLTFSMKNGSPAVDAAFLVGFVAALSLWATYFLHTAERGAQAIAAETASRIGRAAYNYAHAVMVAGVIVVAVGIHEAIEAPTESADVGATAVILGGPALYLTGLALFKRWVGQSRLTPPIAAVVALAALLLAVAVAPVDAERLLLAGCATVVLAALAVGTALGVDEPRAR
ncbi:MAG TPA: low temperature requirement protein A [Conexibacter sp.]|jgi:low temperature requirement protein LtrA